MIVCIYCSTEMKTKMDALLSKDHYKDYSELVAMAVENLWVLEREVAEKGVLVIGEGSSSAVMPSASSPIETARAVIVRKAAPKSSRQNEAISGLLVPAMVDNNVRIPDLFLAEGLDGVSCNTVDVLQNDDSQQTFTLDRWLFGQYNKLLPVKANCRALMHLIAGSKYGEPLDTTADRIAEAAAQLGDYLADYDRRYGIGRDDTLATAFPRSGPDTKKSRARYANQFVGSVNSQNTLSGLLWDYRLASLASENGPFLLPTKQAIHLARLMNPILDGCQIEPTQKFSPEEIAFFLDHVRSFVPVEAFAFRTLIHAIADGADTPDRLEEALRPLFPTDSNRSLSPSFLTSQRSGALSRMADLGLIARQRKGVRVLYIVTEQGQHFIESK